jgi:CRISPR-associated protein (TIGR03984 family)
MTRLTGAALQPIEPAAAALWLEGARGAAPPASEGDDLVWLLAHCDDGVVWGRREGARWRLSTAAFPDVSPPLEPRRLQQLRLFGPLREVLLWRAPEGLVGRVLLDAGPVGGDDPRRPRDEEYVLLGDRPLGPPRDGFTLVGDARGSRHAVPVVCLPAHFQRGPRAGWPLRLQVRHYFAEEEPTGLVRAAATRLVHVRLDA